MHPIKVVWMGMHGRCSPSGPYFARGISVCDRWSGVGGYASFLLDMARGYARGLEIDRIDNDGDYTPGNVRWVTRSVNCRNRRSNVHLTVRGRTQTAVAWAEEVGLRPSVLYGRLRKGWGVERAVMEPLDQERSSRYHRRA